MAATSTDPRITRIEGERDLGPTESIGVLEVRVDGSFRVALAERAEVDGRCHIRLACQAWGSKDALDTRWWSLVLDRHQKIVYVRNGSCSDPVTTADVPRITHALEQLDLMAPESMIVVDGGSSVFPWLARRGT